MALDDRDYYRKDPRTQAVLRGRFAVTALVTATVVAWFLQLVFRGDGRLWEGKLTRLLSAGPADLFAGFPQLWRLVTASFAYEASRTEGAWRLAVDLVVLYHFGREVEILHGRLRFVAFYFAGGAVSTFALTLAHWLAGSDEAVRGASGAVAGIVVLYALLYPRGSIYFVLVTAPISLLAALYIGQDLLTRSDPGLPVFVTLARLSGVACGVVFWLAVRSGAGRRTRGKVRIGARAQRRSFDARSRTEGAQQAERGAVPDAVSQRVDELLAKIHAQGMASLSDEERSFLVENSRRYRQS